MTIIVLTIVIFLTLVIYLVVFDIILSWLTLVGIRFRPKFISDILGPLYKFVRSYIPTRFGAFDFTAMIIIFIIIFIRGLLLINFPQVNVILNQFVG